MALGRNISPRMGKKYYRKDDYYIEREGGEEHKLEWGGKLAQELGLSGKASAEAWENALNGYFPGGIEIQGGSMKDPKTGERVRRAGTDFEFSAPKSVSIQALVFGDERLIEAHREAAQEAMDFLEEQVGARRKHEGTEWETTGVGLTGRVTHVSNREGEPHLHDHGVWLNITLNSDGEYQAMTNDRMFEYQRPAQEVYFAGLCRRLERLGYEFEIGKYGEPQLKGITREHIEFFSSRGRKIEDFLKEKWGVDRKTATPEQKQVAWEMTRKAKKVRDLDGLQARWQEEAQEIGLEKVIPGKKSKDLSPERRLEIARDSLSFAVAHHTERESAVPEGELIRTALQDGRGKITLEDIRKVLEEAKSFGELIRQTDNLAGRKQNLVTSREALEREKRILRMEREGRGIIDPALNPFQADASLRKVHEREGIRLNDDQKRAATLILTAENRFVGVNGFAGTGKTTMLKPAVETLRAAGYRVVGLAPTHDAVGALREAGISEPRTLHSWLKDRQAGKDLGSGSVVIIDEAGLASAKILESLMKRIEKAGARAVFVGDVRQYESVEAGPALRQLQRNGMKTEFVKKMQRQKNAPEHIRQAARLSVDSPEKALKLLNITEIRNPEERYQAIANAYLKSPDKQETLVLTGTHVARKAVNGHVREGMGLKGKGQEFTRFEVVDFSAAQKENIRTYHPGMEIRFGFKYKGISLEQWEVATVAAVDTEMGIVTLKKDNGSILKLKPSDLRKKFLEVGQREKIDLAQGDRIRITGNELKELGIKKGMKGEVLETAHDGIRVRFDSGFERWVTVRKTPIEVDHGYAQTGHSAQGLGAENVILDLPSSSQTLNRRSFYTNLTRTKGQIIAYTDDRERLTGAVTREKDKTLAHDVEKEQKIERKPWEKARKTEPELEI